MLTILIKISPNVMEQAEILHTWKILGSQSINQSINQLINQLFNKYKKIYK
jgi:hypothetical protein